MGNYDRTRKSIRNSFVAIVVQIVSLLVGFFSRKIFLDYLGTEVLGLNTTASSILNFLNLAEMGIESAVAATLYKPLFDNDRETIREIIAIQGWFYKRVAVFIIFGSLILMPFFPRIFTKMQLPMSYAYGSYIILLFSSLLGYFINYKQIILTADQQDFKFQLSYRSVMILKVIFQIFAVRFLPNPYLWWLLLEFAFAILAALVLRLAVNRHAPYLKDRCIVDRSVIEKYPGILSKIKQAFVHRMGYFATIQAAPLFIYAFSNLSTVALYGNYMVIVNSLQSLFLALFSSITSSVGNMVAEGDRKLTLRVFGELFSSRLYIVSCSCVCLWLLMEPFIGLWIGDQYILDRSTLLLIISVFGINMLYTVTESFINAYGLFKDVWASILRAVVFVILAVLLGKRFGLNGVLCASLVECFLLYFIWRPLFLFRYGISESIVYFIKLCVKLLLISGSLAAAVILIENKYDFNPIVLCAAYSIILAAILILCDDGMRSFFNRLKTVFKAGQ